MTATDSYRSAPEHQHPKAHLPRDLREEPAAGVLTTVLGLFSIGLGLAELTVPHKVAARTGVPYRGLVRAYGLRELATGIRGILTARRPGPWLMARVAGDVLDLAALGATYLDARGAGRRRAAEAAVAVAGVTALDLAAAAAHRRGPS